MDLVYLFVSFVNAIGFDVFLFLTLLYFVITGLVYIKQPLMLAFFIVIPVGIFLLKPGLLLFLDLWPFELTAVMIAFFVFVKKEADFNWFWVLLLLAVFAWWV